MKEIVNSIKVGEELNKDLLNIPIRFTKKEDCKIKDTRFVKVSIDLCHTLENFNGSFFSKDILEEAIPSLANTPILAYIEKDETDLDDFSDHRREYEDGKIAYKGNAIGVIAENNNARFEIKPDDEGVMREYLVVDGLMWTKWNTPLEIFDRRGGQAAQSMEIHEDCDGYVDENTGLFHFTEVQFYGACILGKDIQPAMAGANIKIDFSVDDFTKETQTKMEEFKNFQLKIKEGERMDKKLEILKKYSKTKEELTDIDLETISEADLEVKLTEMAKSDDDKKKEEELKAKKKKEEEDEKKAKFESDEEKKKEDEEKAKAKKKKEEEEEDEDKYKKLYEEYTSLKEEVTELREFKQDTLTDKRKSDETELFAKYEVLDNVKEFQSLKDKSADFSTLDDLEKEIALVFAKVSMDTNKQRSFSKKEDGSELENKISFQQNADKEIAYGGLLVK